MATRVLPSAGSETGRAGWAPARGNRIRQATGNKRANAPTRIPGLRSYETRSKANTPQVWETPARTVNILGCHLRHPLYLMDRISFIAKHSRKKTHPLDRQSSQAKAPGC